MQQGQRRVYSGVLLLTNFKSIKVYFFVSYLENKVCLLAFGFEWTMTIFHWVWGEEGFKKK